MITEAQLITATGCSVVDAMTWAQPLNAAMDFWGVFYPKRIAGFLAQTSHESGCFTDVEEGMSYSAQRLMQVWPNRFPTLEMAREYERQPEKLANFVYARRMGNGDSLTGDGWAFRGKGPLQITGKLNHYRCGIALGLPLVEHPELLLEPYNGAMSAGWFWATHGCNELMDQDNFKEVCIVINGGLVGYDSRASAWALAKTALGVYP